MNLEQTLAKKPLFSATIDVTRMPRAYDLCKNSINIPKVIHIIGTNGKGSTGRFLALMLQQSGKKVGHYTSPHINRFNERFWINGDLVNDSALEKAHEYLQTILPQALLDELSYFEYATFLGAIVFKDCDMVVMEAGLGGEWDATNVFPKQLSIVTPVGLDHQDFLGDTLVEIAQTKIRSIQTTTILAQNQPLEVLRVARKIASERNIELIEKPMPLEEMELKNIQSYVKKYLYPDFLQANISLAYSAAKLLHVKPEVSTLPPLDLKARFEWVENNVLVDCGHNPLAASALVSALGDGKFTFIYNAYDDKDVRKVIEILLPKIESLHVIPMAQNGRKDARDKITTIAKEYNIPLSEFNYKLDSRENYVVFGSFGVVEAFMKGIYA